MEPIRGRNISDGAVKPVVVVLMHKVSDNLPGFLQSGRRLGTDALFLDGLMPPLDFAVALRVKWGCPHMGHPADPDKFLEFLGDKLRPVVRDDPRSDARKPFPGSLNDDLYIGFGHTFSDLPVSNVSAIPIQGGTQIIEGAADIDVGDIHVPVLMRTPRLVKSFPLFG